MSDPAATNQNQSYVDTYVPPTVGSTSVQPVASSTNQSNDFDPIKKLEELVAEFETKKDERKTEQLEDIQKLEEVANAKQPTTAMGQMESNSDQPKLDPLAELERALDEYEKKYQAKVDASKARIAAKSDDNAPTLSIPIEESRATEDNQLPTAEDKVTLADLEKAVGQFENQTASPEPKLNLEQPADSMASSASNNESIDEQNIFDLLGVGDATDTEKEAFLDELQQALWEDFLDKDLFLLVSETELAEINKIKADTTVSEEQRQVSLIEKIEEFVPDIEEIMLEKALELKEDMVMERLTGIRESFKQNNADQTKLDEAENHFKNGHWKTGSQILNSL